VLNKEKGEAAGWLAGRRTVAVRPEEMGLEAARPQLAGWFAQRFTLYAIETAPPADQHPGRCNKIEAASGWMEVMRGERGLVGQAVHAAI